jgi:hypothetical protein
MIMTEAAKENLQSPRPSFLTEEQIFRLWSSAIKDDHRLIDEVIRRVYEQMIAYDRARSGAVIQLTIRRNATAGGAFQRLLEDMQSVSTPNAIKH